MAIQESPLPPEGMDNLFDERSIRELELRDRLYDWEERLEGARGSTLALVRSPNEPDGNRNTPVIIDVLAVPSVGPLFGQPESRSSIVPWTTVHFKGARASLVMYTQDPDKLDVGVTYCKPTVEHHPEVLRRAASHENLVASFPLMGGHEAFSTIVLDKRNRIVESHGYALPEDMLRHVPLEDFGEFLSGALSVFPETHYRSITFNDGLRQQATAWLNRLNQLYRGRREQLAALSKGDGTLPEKFWEDRCVVEPSAAEVLHSKYGTRGLVHHLVVAESPYDAALTGENVGQLVAESLEKRIVSEMEDYAQKGTYLSYVVHGW